MGVGEVRIKVAVLFVELVIARVGNLEDAILDAEGVERIRAQRLVGSTAIIRQSKVEITGLMSPRAAASPSSTTCSPRS